MLFSLGIEHPNFRHRKTHNAPPNILLQTPRGSGIPGWEPLMKTMRARQTYKKWIYVTSRTPLTLWKRTVVNLKLNISQNIWHLIKTIYFCAQLSTSIPPRPMFLAIYFKTWCYNVFISLLLLDSCVTTSGRKKKLLKQTSACLVRFFNSGLLRRAFWRCCEAVFFSVIDWNVFEMTEKN